MNTETTIANTLRNLRLEPKTIQPKMPNHRTPGSVNIWFHGERDECPGPWSAEMSIRVHDLYELMNGGFYWDGSNVDGISVPQHEGETHSMVWSLRGTSADGSTQWTGTLKVSTKTQEVLIDFEPDVHIDPVNIIKVYASTHTGEVLYNFEFYSYFGSRRIPGGWFPFP